MLLPGGESAAVAIGRSKQHHDVVVVVDDDGDKDVGDDDAVTGSKNTTTRCMVSMSTMSIMCLHLLDWSANVP